MAKIILLLVIAVSVSAQFADRRENGEFGKLRVNQEGELAANHHHRHITDHIQVGGFQNGHFAETDGRLRTNLDSKPDNDYQPQDESQYVVEEGAAFRKPVQHDVHSSLGRVVDISFVTQERNNNERSYMKNDESQDFGRREQRPTSVKIQTELTLIGLSSNEQNNPYQDNHQININLQSQQAKNQESRNYNEGQTNIRYEGHNIDSSQEINRRNGFDNRNTQQIKQTNTNSTNTRNRKPVSNVNNDATSKRNQSYDIEAINREINNQISKAIFSESTLEVTTKSNTKTTKDNELHRSNSGKQDDRWIWNDDTMKNVTTNASTTVVPTVDDRAAFAGDQCPTGKVRVNNMCVEGD